MKNLQIEQSKSLSDISQVEEKEMMGGLTFVVRGKMCVGTIKYEMMCRIAPELSQHSNWKKLVAGQWTSPSDQ